MKVFTQPTDLCYPKPFEFHRETPSFLDSVRVSTRVPTFTQSHSCQEWNLEDLTEAMT